MSPCRRSGSPLYAACDAVVVDPYRIMAVVAFALLAGLFAGCVIVWVWGWF